MSILLSGSLAYDYILDFPDSFRNHILPDKAHMINLSFVIPELKKEFGGCAGNMAYTIKLLGGEPIILAPLGTDGAAYRAHCRKHKIKTKYMPLAKQHLTSSAHITTDKDDNQIAAFHVGAGGEASQLSVHAVKEEIKLAKQEDFEEKRSQLEERVGVIQQGLSRCGINSAQLGSEEIVEVFYKVFNPGEVEGKIKLE